MTEEARSPATFRWWLRLQIALMLGGGAVGVVGLVTEEDFVVGAAVGLLVGGLALRFGRRASPDSPAAAERAATDDGSRAPGPGGAEAAER